MALIRITTSNSYEKSPDSSDLNKLLKEIKDKDNVKFKELDELEGLDNKEIEKFDRQAENLFDAFVEYKQNVILDIVKNNRIENQINIAIKAEFHNFLEKIQNGDIPADIDLNLENHIKNFQEAIETIKNEEHLEIDTSINLYKLELQNLKGLLEIWNQELGELHVGGPAWFKSAFERTSSSWFIVVEQQVEPQLQQTKPTINTTLSNPGDSNNIEAVEENLNIKFRESAKINFETKKYIETPWRENHKQANLNLRDIYKNKNNLHKVLAGLGYANAELQKPSTRNVNLSSENWLAWLFLQIQEESTGLDVDNTMELKTIIKKIGEKYLDGTSINIENFLNDLQNKWFEYKGNKSDKDKLKTILENLTLDQMQELLILLNTSSNNSKLVNSYFNSKKMLDSGKEYITANIVLDFLSDINGDWIISADTWKNNEQYKVWDVWLFSWSQINYHLYQVKWAIGADKLVKNIAKIISRMNTLDELVDDNSAKLITMWLKTVNHSNFQTDLEKLQKLEFNNNKDPEQQLLDFLKKYPFAKVMFLTGIEREAGWSDSVVNLYDILADKEASRFEDEQRFAQEQAIKNSIEEFLQKEDLPEELQRLKNSMWESKVKTTIFQNIMTFVDWFALATFFDGNTKVEWIAVGKQFKKYEEYRNYLLSKINRIGLGASRNWIALGYDWAKVDISDDLKNKLTKHVDGWITLPWTEEWWLGVFAGTWFEQQRQTNYNKISNTSLEDTLKKPSKYFGVWWSLFWSLNTGSAWIWAEAHISAERNYINGMVQMERLYSNVSDQVFDISGLSDFTANGIKNKLDNNLNTLITTNSFAEANKTKLRNDITIMVKFLQTSGILDDINKDHRNRKTNLQSLINILQQGAIEQWKSDLVMNLHNKSTSLTKASLGMGIGASWEFLKKKQESTTSTSSGVSSDINPSWVSTLNERNEVERTQILSRLPFVGLRFSKWTAQYTPNINQRLFAENEITEWRSYKIEKWNDLKEYATSLESMINIDGIKVNKETMKINWNDNAQYLEFAYNKPGIHQNLTQIINIYYAPNDKTSNNFVLNGNKLSVFDVGEIAVYSITDKNWVYITLCLWWTSPEGMTKLTKNHDPKADKIESMEFKQNWYEVLSKEQLDNAIGWLPNEIQKTYKSLFDSKWKLKKIGNVEFMQGLYDGQSFSTGTLTLYQKSEWEYILDYNDSMPENNLKLEYKFAWNSFNNIMWPITNPLLKDEQITWFPDRENNAKLEYNTQGNKESVHFAPFMAAIVSGDITSAINNLKEMENIPQEHKTILNRGTDDEKAYLVQRYVSLFAYEDVYKNRTMDKFHRSDSFLNLKWPNKSAQFSDDLKNILPRYKEDFLNTHKKIKHEDIKTETPENIFGYTAFYRNLKGGGIENKWYASTRLWETNIAAWSKKTIGEWLDNMDDLQKNAKKRIADNLKNDPAQRDQLIRQINKLLKTEDQPEYITENNLYDLLTNWEIEITPKGENPLDISTKKLKLNANAIFYLLRECINESVWLEITGITIEDNIQTEHQETNPDPKYESHIYARAFPTSAIPGIKEKTVTIWAASKTSRRKTNKQNETINTPWWTDNITNPDWTTNPPDWA